MHTDDTQRTHADFNAYLEANFARLIQWGLDAGADPEEIAGQLPHQIHQLLWELAIEAGHAHPGEAA